MYLNISFWLLAAYAFIAWIIQVIMSAKQPEELLDFEWQEYKQTFVNQANRLVFLVCELPVAWFFNNYVLFGFNLSPLTWAIRAHAAFVAITEVLIFFVSLISAFKRQTWMLKTALASLAVAVVSTLIFLAI